MSGFAVSPLLDDIEGRVFGYYQDVYGNIHERQLQGSNNWTVQGTADLVASNNSAKSTTSLAATSLLLSNTLYVSLS